MFFNGLAFDANGRLLLKGVEGTDLGNGNFEYHSEIYALDPVTANKTHVARLTDALSGLDSFSSDVLAINQSNQAFTIQRNYDSNFAFQTAFLQRIDLPSGVVTTIGGDLGLEFTALAFTPSPAAVPEPSQLLWILAILPVLPKRCRTPFC